MSSLGDILSDIRIYSHRNWICNRGDEGTTWLGLIYLSPKEQTDQHLSHYPTVSLERLKPVWRREREREMERERARERERERKRDRDI